MSARPRIIGRGSWKSSARSAGGAGYDSLEGFYAAHQEQHPDIRHYAAVGEEFISANTRPDGLAIAQRIAERRASAD